MAAVISPAEPLRQTKSEQTTMAAVDRVLLDSAWTIANDPTVTASRRYRLRTYDDCFEANAAVGLLLAKGEAATRAEAVAIGQRLLDEGLIRHVSHPEEMRTFEDGDKKARAPTCWPSSPAPPFPQFLHADELVELNWERVELEGRTWSDGILVRSHCCIAGVDRGRPTRFGASRCSSCERRPVGFLVRAAPRLLFHCCTVHRLLTLHALIAVIE